MKRTLFIITLYLSVFLFDNSFAQPMQYGMVFDTTNGFIYSFGQKGIIKSANNGYTWKQLKLDPNVMFVYAMVNVDGAPNKLFAAARINAYPQTARNALFASTDMGKTWDSIAPPLPFQWYEGMAVSHKTHSIFLGTDQGFWRYRYDLKQWNDCTPPNETDMGIIAVSDADTNVIYTASTFVTQYFQSRLWRSSNSGASWINILDSTSIPIAGLYADPANANHVFETDNWIRESFDGGLHWSKALNENIIGMTAYDWRTNLWYAGPWYGELFSSTTGGVTWNLLPCPDSSLLNALCVDPRNPCHVFALHNDGVFESTDCGATWTQNTLTIVTGVFCPEQYASSMKIKSIFPNPVAASSTVLVEVEGEANEQSTVVLKLYDVLGRMVKDLPPTQVNNGKEMISLPIDGLPCGIYTLYLQTGYEEQMKGLIIR